MLPLNLTILHDAGLKTNFGSEANEGEWECKMPLQRILQGVHVLWGQDHECWVRGQIICER